MNSLSMQTSAYFKLPEATYHSDMTFPIIAKGQTLPFLPLFHHHPSYSRSALCRWEDQQLLFLLKIQEDSGTLSADWLLEPLWALWRAPCVWPERSQEPIKTVVVGPL